MTQEIARTADYPRLLSEVKERIRSAQYAALNAVNAQLVDLYWDIGQMIVERQETVTGHSRPLLLGQRQV